MLLWRIHRRALPYSCVRVAIVFPRANRRAGVERVAWDLSDYLAQRHDTTFVGLAMDDQAENTARFHSVKPSSSVRGPLAFRRSAEHALAALQPDVVLSLGAECPPGDVYWVQSVHRAYLDRSHGPIIRGRQAPPWIRQLMPRHRVVLAVERRYFDSTRPCTILCTSSQEVADLDTYYDIPASRCRVMPNGYDPALFNAQRRADQRDAARSRLGLGDDGISLLFVANELHRKGFGTLLSALARIDLPEARIDVVGRVSPVEYQSTIERLGLTNRIHWHGSTSEVFPFYAAADVLVLPTQYEPFGIVIVEALASGLPVITSRLAGAAPAVETGRCGRVLSDPTDVSELAVFLREAADPAIRSDWAAQAAGAAEPYAWPRIFAGVEEILLEAYRSRHLSS
jgi:UDP-glucose:(heptosyl)LPS alpha-1,3-glucosyltransferase